MWPRSLFAPPRPPPDRLKMSGQFIVPHATPCSLFLHPTPITSNFEFKHIDMTLHILCCNVTLYVYSLFENGQSPPITKNFKFFWEFNPGLCPEDCIPIVYRRLSAVSVFFELKLRHSFKILVQSEIKAIRIWKLGPKVEKLKDWRHSARI